MVTIFERIRILLQAGDIRISEHGYDELVEDGLTVRDVLNGALTADIVEEYPEYPKGPCVLVLQKDGNGEPSHVVWGIPKGYDAPAVMVTAYRPDPDKWDETFLRRRS